MSTMESAAERKELMVKEIKTEASKINPKAGSTVSTNKYIIVIGKERIKSLQKEAEQKMSDNNERYSSKVAQELNAPIKADLSKEITTVKNIARKAVNSNLDAREKRIDETRVTPIPNEVMERIQTFRMLIDLGAKIPERDWTLLGEQVAGHYLAEKAYIALAKSQDITVIPTVDLDKSVERIEQFREMANNAIDNLDNPDANLTAFAFFSDKNEALDSLIDEIDSDVSTIIPAKRRTVLERLKDAKEHARNKDDYSLSAKIGLFIDRNMERLAEPQELTDALYSEAEDFIKQGMSAGEK